MKKIEPTKNVTPIAGREVEAHCDAIPPATKHSDPIENRTAIHQPRLCGRHQTESVSCRARLRCARDCQRTSVPSGRRKTSLVTNGPGPSAVTRSQPSGKSTYPRTASAR